MVRVIIKETYLFLTHKSIPPSETTISSVFIDLANNRPLMATKRLFILHANKK